ncbi:AbrB/MazE/SpoVT family DNA-binding domain-containing protein [Aquifex pyrophilus]
MLVKKTSKNQITLPKEVLKNFPEAEYFEVRVEKGRIVLIPVKTIPSNITLEKIRKKIKIAGLTERDIEEAVKWARES